MARSRFHRPSVSQSSSIKPASIPKRQRLFSRFPGVDGCIADFELSLRGEVALLGVEQIHCEAAGLVAPFGGVDTERIGATECDVRAVAAFEFRARILPRLPDEDLFGRTESENLDRTRFEVFFHTRIADIAELDHDISQEQHEARVGGPIGVPNLIRAIGILADERES